MSDKGEISFSLAAFQSMLTDKEEVSKMMAQVGPMMSMLGGAGAPGRRRRPGRCRRGVHEMLQSQMSNLCRR